MKFKIQHFDNQTLMTWRLSPKDVTGLWFDPQYWQDQEKIYAQKQGRATTWFFQHDKTKGVLRHYWRGGLIAKLLRDQYFYWGLSHTRVYKEFRLLTLMHKKGLNVPFPIAASISRHGLIYRGDLITGAIPEARSLLDILKLRRLSVEEVNKVATCIAKFHQQGVCHSDLNINNILFSRYHTVYLIDFDRCEIRPLNPKWQRQNIARLQRSFIKEAGRNSEFHWQEEDWTRLLECYEGKMYGGPKKENRRPR